MKLKLLLQILLIEVILDFKETMHQILTKNTVLGISADSGPVL